MVDNFHVLPNLIYQQFIQLFLHYIYGLIWYSLHTILNQDYGNYNNILNKYIVKVLNFKQQNIVNMDNSEFLRKTLGISQDSQKHLKLKISVNARSYQRRCTLCHGTVSSLSFVTANNQVLQFNPLYKEAYLDLLFSESNYLIDFSELRSHIFWD